jgi:lipoprotein signal peptidase
MTKKYTMHKSIAILTIALGLLLMFYMIRYESEPGAQPLLLILLGGVGLTFQHFRTKRKSPDIPLHTFNLS